MSIQLKKNIKLAIWLVILSGLTVAAYWYELPAENSFADKSRFTIADSSRIVSVTMTPQGEEKDKVALSKTNNGWLINDQYPADARMSGLVLAVMQNVEVGRRIGEVDEEFVETLKQNSVLVEVGLDDGSGFAFYAGGNGTKTTSYFVPKEEEEAYVVRIPGYSSYVSGIFDLQPNDWRERHVFHTNWNSLRSLVLYDVQNEKEMLNIRYEDNFFNIEGIRQLDTTEMMNYLENTTGLEVDQYIEVIDFPVYDSLSQLSPQYRLTVEDIDSTRQGVIELFPANPGDQFRLVKVMPGEELARIRINKVNLLLRNTEEFTARQE